MIKVLSFDKMVHNLEQLKSMTDTEKLELAKTGMMLGNNDVDICTLQQFQEYYNAEMASPEHTYIFFVESETEK